MSEFFAMGGYAAYVWSAYGITLAVVTLNVWLAQRRYYQALRAVSRPADNAVPMRQPTVRKLT
jgi:heme exporter protein D